MADEHDKRVRGSAIPRAYEPVGGDALLVRTEADMKGLLVSNHVWDSDAGAWVKMAQPTIEAGDLYLSVDDVEDKLEDIKDKLDELLDAAEEVYWNDVRMEYTANVIDYRGRHTTLNAATSDLNWLVEKFTWSGVDCVRIQKQVTSWNARTSGWS